MRKKNNSVKVSVLKSSEADISGIKFEELFKNISSWVAIYRAVRGGEDFLFVDVNPAVERIEKVKRQELIGKSVVEVFPDVKEFGLFEVFQRVWQTGKAEHLPISLYKDERICGWRQNYVCKLPSGEIVAIYDDVTEKRRAEFALRMGKQCFEAIADYSYFWEIWVSPAGRCIWLNSAVERITGYSVREFMAMRDFPDFLFDEAGREEGVEVFNSALAGGSGEGVRFRLRRRDGEVVFAEMSWRPILDEKNISLGYRASIRDITKQEQVEEQLQIARFSLERAVDAVFWIDSEGQFYYVNEAACSRLGYSREELLWMGVADIDPNFPRQAWPEHWQRVRCEGSFRFESCHRRKAGDIIPVEISVNYLNFEGKEYNCVFARDISERKRTEEEIARLAKLPEENPNPVIRISDGGKVLYRNKAALELIGEGSQVEGESLLPEIQKYAGEALRDETPLQKKLIWAGRSFLVNCVGVPDLGYVNIYTQEITEQERLARELRESEEQFRLISEQSVLGIIILQDDLIRYANRAAADIVGYSVEEMLAWKPKEAFLRLVHPDDLRFVSEQERIKQRGEKGYMVNYAWKAITKTGQTKWVETYSRPVMFRGKFADLVSMIDISNTKRTEDALRASEEKYHNIFISANDIIIICDSLGNIIEANPCAEKLTGYSNYELLGKSVLKDLITGDDRAKMKQVMEELMSGRSQRYTTHWQTKHGSIVELEGNSTPKMSEEGDFIYSQCILRATKDVE